MRLSAKLHFPAPGYIAHPYWPAQNQRINILKESGMNRARTQEARDRKLRDYLETKKMSMDDFYAIELQANEQFYRNGTPKREIIIPKHQIYGMLANAADRAGSAIRIASREQIRNVVLAEDWHTGKTKADGTWLRNVQVMSAGGKLSNQRMERTNDYIVDFDTEAVFEFSDDEIDVDKFCDFLAWAGRWVGVGASRKMGYGRWETGKLSVLSSETRPTAGGRHD